MPERVKSAPATAPK